MEAKIALRQCGIDTLNLKCDHQALVNAGENLNINLKFNQRVQGSLSERLAKISLTCALSVREPEEKSEQARDNLCEILLDYFGLFTFVIDEAVDIEKEKEEIKALLSVNGTSVLFPYLRATITSITASAGIDPIVLPTFNIHTLLERSSSSVEIAD